jgi:hypothetical protein
MLKIDDAKQRLGKVRVFLLRTINYDNADITPFWLEVILLVLRIDYKTLTPNIFNLNAVASIANAVAGKR